MRVALDATPLTLSSGGLARYTAELARALAAEYERDEFFLLSDQPFAMPPGSLANLRSARAPQSWLDRKWWLWGLDREMKHLGCDLFHGTNFAVPYLARRPSVLTLHDLSPWMNREWHHAAERVRSRTPWLIGLGIATMIVTVSDAVRKQAIEHFGIAPGRIATVPLAASEIFRPAAESLQRPYFLFAGTLEPRKNIPALIAAWRVLRRDWDVDLILAGRRRDDFPDLAPEPGLHVAGELSDEDLAVLYSGAIAFVYPSLYEGFGLPVLEAMQCGACVITSRDPAIAEVVGGAAIRCDPADLYEAMRAVLMNPEWAREWGRRGLLRASEFSWARTARRTREVYDEAQRRFATC
jgi:glycosyltransferase involved in cell wall biosynthesis